MNNDPESTTWMPVVVASSGLFMEFPKKARGAEQEAEATPVRSAVMGGN